MIAALADPVAMIEQGAPRIIRTEAELKQYTRSLFHLTAKDEPTDSELEAIDLLSMLIERYEHEHHAIPPAPPQAVLRLLMDSHGLKQKDLVPEIGSETGVSLILKGERNLTVSHIRALAARFHVPASAFLEGQ